MKKFLIAAATAFLIFGGQAGTEASTVGNSDTAEVQEMKSHGKWSHFRDKHILGRETENERRDREEWERRHRRDYRRDYYRDDYPPPPPRYRGYDYPPPHHRGYDYPPPPPRGGHNYPPPPCR